MTLSEIDALSQDDFLDNVRPRVTQTEYDMIKDIIDVVNNQSVFVPANSFIARTTNGAPVATTETTTNDIMYKACAFDTTTEEGVGFWHTFPPQWDLGTVTATFFWTAASGSGTVKFDIGGRAYANDDALDQAIGTQGTATDTLITALDMHVSPETAAVTLAGTPAANLPCYFEVTRDIADTLGVDALLIGVLLKYSVV